MKIAIDIDEVLAHFLPAFIQYNNDIYDTDLNLEDFSSYRFEDVLEISTEEVIDRLYDFYTTEYFINIEPIAEAIAAIKELQEEDQYEFIIITSRPLDIQNETYDWLDYHFPNTFSEIYFAHHPIRHHQSLPTKADICRELEVDVLIEDSRLYAEECSEYVDKVFLLDYPWNQSTTLPENVERVYSWDAILKNLL